MQPSAKPTPKIPLLTPSPSPHLFVPKISNGNDGPPPQKRQRLSSPQMRAKPIPASFPSNSNIPLTVDYVKERHAAMMRLFDVWSSLAERYAKPIEEDDVVDILTGEIVQDRGVISNWDESTKGIFTGIRAKKKEGSNSKAGERIQQSEGGGAEGGGEEERRREEDGCGTDELDLFAPEDFDDDAHSEVESRSIDDSHVDTENTTPVTDDKVLEERVEAEKRREEGDDNSSDDELEIYRIQLSQFQTPRPNIKLHSEPSPSTPLPLALSKHTWHTLPDDDGDEDLEIYEAQLRQFRSTAKSKLKIPGIVDDGCLPIKNRSDPSPSPPRVHQFRTPRPYHKHKWRVIIDSDDEVPPLGLKSRPQTPSSPPLPSSPVASDLADYRSDSPATLPPPSSSPVLLPLEDESDDELCGWNLE